MHEEIKDGSDDLSVWSKDETTETSLLLYQDSDPELVSYVIDEGYANDLTDAEVEKIGRDPFLISYALTGSDASCVVSTEVSKPKKLRANRHVPDVCKDFEIECINTFEFLRRLNFSTNWQTR